MNRKLLSLIFSALFIVFLSALNMRSANATIGAICYDADGTCGSDATPCTPARDCDFYEYCVPDGGGINNRCAASPAGTCLPPTCNNCANAHDQCGPAGLCDDGEQCRFVSGLNTYTCALPVAPACGTGLPDGATCTNGGECNSGFCNSSNVCGCIPNGGSCGGARGDCCGTCVTNDGGSSYYCFGGSNSCIGYGQVCVNSNGQPLGSCCNNEACTAYDDGQSYCGDPFEIFDIPGVRPNVYSGPVINYETFITNFYQLLLPISIGLIGIPLLILNGYKIMTSEGDPSKIKEGKEGLTAVVMGLLFLLLALSLLRIILNNFFGQSI